MRATRATRHGLRYTAGWCAMALALLLGATLVAAPPAAAQANHLKVALQGDTSNVDLHLTTHYVSRVALLNVYEMLYTLGEDLSIQPMLADKHTISPDALTYTITVRKGVKFHNGKVMDAKDVAYTLNRMRNQGCRSAEFKALVKDVRGHGRLDGPHHAQRPVGRVPRQPRQRHLPGRDLSGGRGREAGRGHHQAGRHGPLRVRRVEEGRLSSG